VPHLTFFSDILTIMRSLNGEEVSSCLERNSRRCHAVIGVHGAAITHHAAMAGMAISITVRRTDRTGMGYIGKKTNGTSLDCFRNLG
jgi:hypothetical protein